MISVEAFPIVGYSSASLCKVERRDAEGDEVFLLIEHEAHKLRVDERDELFGIALDLRVRELHDTVERRIGRIDEFKDLTDSLRK
mgnify:CR=1 FL=1